MAMTLYEIADRYQEALNRLADPNLPSDAVADTLEGLAGELSAKAWHVAALVLNLEGEAELIRHAEERMARRRRALERRAASLQDYLKEQLQRLDLRELRSPEFMIRVKANPPRLVIDDEERLPAAFKQVEIVLRVDRTAVRAALESGASVPGARLEQGTHVEIA